MKHRPSRRYFDCRQRSRRGIDTSAYPICQHGTQRGIQFSLTGAIVAITVPCEHCDGERSRSREKHTIVKHEGKAAS